MYLKGYHVEEDKVLDFPHWMSSSRGLKPPFEDILEKIFLLPAGGWMRWPYHLPRFLFSEWGMLELEDFYIDLHRLTGKQVVCTDINSFLPKKIFTYLKLHVCTASKSKTQCTCIHMCPSLICSTRNTSTVFLLTSLIVVLCGILKRSVIALLRIRWLLVGVITMTYTQMVKHIQEKSIGNGKLEKNNLTSKHLYKCCLNAGQLI